MNDNFFSYCWIWDDRWFWSHSHAERRRLWWLVWENTTWQTSTGRLFTFDGFSQQKWMLFFILLTTDPMPCIAMTDPMIDPMTNLMADTMNSPIQGKFNVCSAYYWLWISQVWWWDWGRGAKKTTVYISRHINYEKLHPTFGHTFFKKRSLLEIFYRPMFPERGNFFAGGVEYV